MLTTLLSSLLLLTTPFAIFGQESEGTQPADDSGVTASDIDPEALFQEGRDALFRGQYESAIASLQKAVAAEHGYEIVDHNLVLFVRPLRKNS